MLSILKEDFNRKRRLNIFALDVNRSVILYPLLYRYCTNKTDPLIEYDVTVIFYIVQTASLSKNVILYITTIYCIYLLYRRVVNEIAGRDFLSVMYVYTKCTHR